MDLQRLFADREALARAPEKQFVEYANPLGLSHAVLFVSDAVATRDAQYFNLAAIEDTGYTIYTVSEESTILLYVIDVKTPYWSVAKNGLVIKMRKRWDEARDRLGVSSRYQFPDFVVISNLNQTAAVFCRNITADPKT